ncbi:MAG: portal protein [Sphingobium sp.]|uniref:portal protein n=1 Tax=Sphingobium sp. TaxID=1912891 RepID=UPI003BB0F18E
MATLSLNPQTEMTLKEHVKARARTMLGTLDEEKQTWWEIARFTGHPQVEALRTTRNGTQRPKSKPIYDGYATRAFRYVESGLYSGNSSPNRPWFNFGLKRKRDGVEPTQATRVWLGECVSILTMLLASSNFYRVARANYGELGKFAVAAGIMDEHWEKGIVCTALTIGEYAIDVNKDGEVDTLLRIIGMTTRQIVDAFVSNRDGTKDWSKVSENVRSAWNSSQYNQIFTVYHLIEPNSEYREGVWGRDGMRWRSVKWMDCDDRKDTLLEHKGYYEKPFWAVRWKVYGNDVWGVGPGHDVLPDMRELQAQAKRKGEVTDLIVKPPTQGPADFRMTPGYHKAVANMDAGKVEVVYQAPYQAIQLVAADVQECRRAVSEGTYADLFMAITEREGVQPLNDLETQLRNDEKMTQLGPVIEGINTDMLGVVVDRVFGIASRGGLLPPPPEEIEGEEIEIEFISVLAQAQKMMGMGQTERSLAFVGAVAQFQPDVIDMVDGDALVEDHWERSAAPALGIRDKATVDAIRAQRQQQRQMEQMAAMAAPAKQGVEAAALLSELGQQ